MSDQEDNIGEYHQKSEFSKPFLVQQAVQKCMELRSKEMRSGFINFTTTNTGDIKREVILDSRCEFVGAVESLKNLMYPEIQSDKRSKKQLSDYKRKKMFLFGECSINGRKGNRLPVIDEASPVEVTKMRGSIYAGTQTNPRIGYNNELVDYYWDNLVDLSDNLFAELNILIAVKNYFKMKVSYG